MSLKVSPRLGPRLHLFSSELGSFPVRHRQILRALGCVHSRDMAYVSCLEGWGLGALGVSGALGAAAWSPG